MYVSGSVLIPSFDHLFLIFCFDCNCKNEKKKRKKGGGGGGEEEKEEKERGGARGGRSWGGGDDHLHGHAQKVPNEYLLMRHLLFM